MAARSIIDIDVNDESFKRFMTLFQKYQTAVQALPGAWQDAGKATQGQASALADQTAALMAQKRLLADERKAERDADKEERDSEKKRAAADRAHQKALDDRKKAHQQIARSVKDAAVGIGKATIDLAKWATFGLLSGGAGLFGIGALANNVADTRRQALGLGVSTGQLASMNVNYGRFFDPRANLENIASAQGDVTRRWAFSSMGVNPEGRDPASLAIEMATIARRIFREGGGTQQYAEARGLTQFYSMEDLRRLNNTSDEELRSARGSYGRDQAAMGFRDAVGRKWQDLSTELDRAGWKIKSVLVDGLTPLVGPLKDLTASFTEAVASFLASPKLKEWIKDAGEGLKTFSEYLTSPKFGSDMRSIATNFSLVAEGLIKGLRFLHLIPEEDENPKAAEAWKRPSLQYQSRVGKAMMGDFQRWGWSKEQSAGLVANFMHESSLDPMAWGDSGKAYGIAQWHPDRRKEYEKLFGHKMESVTDRSQAMNEQMKFVQYELTKGNEKEAGDLLKKQRTATEAGSVVSHEYERPKLRGIEANKRAKTAEILVTVNNNTGGSAVVTASQLPQ